MKTCAIIAEYSPFHNGHHRQIRLIRESGYDRVICVMSGSFTQRGCPAVFDKWLRTRWALECGADAVFELPVVFSLQTAEKFAYGGVAIINALGVANSLCFGSEYPDADMILEIAKLLCVEPAEYKKTLREQLDRGASFAESRAKAVAACLDDKAARTLAEPNSILAVEYAKAILKLNSNIKLFPVKREAGNYHSQDLNAGFPSATAIRAALRENSFEAVRRGVPEAVFPSLKEACETGRGPVFAEAFETAIIASLRRMGAEEIRSLPDVTEGVENRIKKAADRANTLEELLSLAASPRLIRSRVHRICACALLGITRQDAEYANSASAALYARLLGFRESAAPLLTEIKARSVIPVIAKAADYSKHPGVERLFTLDAAATDIHSLALSNPACSRSHRDFTEQIIRLP